MKMNLIVREKSILASLLVCLVFAVILVAAYNRIEDVLKQRSLDRMEEGVKTVIEEVADKFERDSAILNATAAIISDADEFDAESLQDTLESVAPLLSTMRGRILMPDNTVIQADGTVLDGGGDPDFQTEAPLGEHVSNRATSVVDNSTLVLRHFVPIVKDDLVVAVLYGVTRLVDLPEIMNIDNIYNASASVFIIDTDNGDYIMDTWRGELGNIYSTDIGEIRGSDTVDDILERIMNLETGQFIYRPTGSDSWQYFYYAPAGVNQWAIGVSVPERVSFGAVYAIQRIVWVVTVLILLVMILYYVWVRRNARHMLEQAVERAVLEEKLVKAETAERAKTTFLSNMSHDIRTPMSAIIGFTTLAQANLDNRTRVQEYLSKILSSSNHLLSLINDVLDMSRIESGRLNIEEKECSISEIFRDMRNILQPQMQSKQLNFFMDTVDVVDEYIYCDKLHVNQVLLNLLGNAIKFTPAGGSVFLSIRQKPGAPAGYGAYEITVKDTGIGMSPEFAKHVFEPFERERSSTISGIQGTGLGMAITKSIVDTMGGAIELTTEQGKGTTFVVNFAFRLQADSGKTETVQALKGLRALVVDDSFDACDSVTKMLVQIGMRSEWTLRGKEAMLRAQQAMEIGDAYNAYLVDWALPDLSGIEVVRQIRSLAGNHVPIIVLTAYDWSDFADEARAAGVNAFCSKPLFLSDLRDTLIAAMSRTEQAAEEPQMIRVQEDMKGKRLLLVEDNELNLEIATELLSEAGFLIEDARDGAEAVKRMQEAAPGYYDLVLMDIQMPVMNGYEATRAIRALEDPVRAGIPIVAMTANAFAEDRKRALESGMNDHVAKPIDVDKLMSSLQGLLTKPKQ